MRTIAYIFGCIALLSACASPVDKKEGKSIDLFEKNQQEISPVSDEPAPHSKRKVINKTGYTVKVIPALQFLQNKGEKVAAADREGLAKEVVVFLEIHAPDPKKDFFEAPGIMYTKEEGVQYLTGNITQDVSLIQEKERFYPSGASFERIPGKQNTIRVLLFFNEIDINKKMQISYYDRMLDAGIINFGINNN